MKSSKHQLNIIFVSLSVVVLIIFFIQKFYNQREAVISMPAKNGKMDSYTISDIQNQASSIFCINQKPKSARERDKLKGKVKMFTEQVYSAKEESDGPAKTSLFAKNTSKYDEKGNSIESTRDIPSLGDGAFFHSTYTYDSKHHLLNIEEYTFQEILNLKSTFMCDDSGNVLVRKQYNEDGNLTQTTNYQYDSNGNQCRIQLYNYYGVLQLADIYRYNKNGNILEMKMINGKGILLNDYVYKNDDDGNSIEDSVYTYSGKTGKTFYTYNYDSTGNWIKKVTYDEHHHANYITERAIQYY
jgi:hypothetical protein